MKNSQKELWKKFAIFFGFLAIICFSMADLDPVLNWLLS